jgi:hypothetical protein
MISRRDSGVKPFFSFFRKCSSLPRQTPMRSREKVSSSGM